MILLDLLASAVVLLSLGNADGIYHSGDTVKVYATVDGVCSLVHSEVAQPGPDNRIFHYEDTCIGWVVNPEEFRQAVPAEKDFLKYWKKQKKDMRRIPMNPVLKEVKTETGADGREYVCYDVKLDCVDGTPVRGYIAMPRDAAKRSLPIVEFLHAAGVAGHWCRAKIDETLRMAQWGGGAICININAFGMENDREQAYYDALEQGELKGYSTRPCEKREEYFFRGMYLRAVRALDYACSLPQWDRKRVLAYGQSQGGNQAFALSGLDPRVSAVVGIVPGGCNPAGSAAEGGKDSWPYTYTQFANSENGRYILSYYDCCNFLAQTKADLFIEIGLMDNTCKPSAIYAALNGNKSKNVTVLTSPWRYHNEPDPRYWKDWNNTIQKARMEFVNEYLK